MNLLKYKAVHIGQGAYISAIQINGIFPYKGDKLLKEVRDKKKQTPDKIVDMTFGRKTRSVIKMTNGDIYLSNLSPETIAKRFGGNIGDSSENEWDA